MLRTCLLALFLCLPAMASAAPATASIEAPAAVDGLPGVHVLQGVDPESGVRLAVYADAVSLPTARREMPGMLRALATVARLVGVDAGAVEWNSVQFTNAEATYVALRARGLGTWRVPTDAAGALARGEHLGNGHSALRATLPHEQAHRADSALRGMRDVPLWWAEGLATWVGDQVTDAVYPDATAQAARRERQAGELAAAAGLIDLRTMYRTDTPRPEAILRQLSPAQAERFRATGRMPEGVAFAFEAGDLDQSPHIDAHYVAAARLFARVDREAGREAMHRWFAAVGREPAGTLDSDRLAALCLEATGVDIRLDLDDRGAAPR